MHTYIGSQLYACIIDSMWMHKSDNAQYYMPVYNKLALLCSGHAMCTFPVSAIDYAGHKGTSGEQSTTKILPMTEGNNSRLH